jgi:hypothetical protein
VSLGNSESDAASISGFANSTPTGTVTFYVTTATKVHKIGTADLSVVLDPGTATADSAAYTSKTTGTYCFVAFYSGDSNYMGASDSAIPGECFTVSAGQAGSSHPKRHGPRHFASYTAWRALRSVHGWMSSTQGPVH